MAEKTHGTSSVMIKSMLVTRSVVRIDHMCCGAEAKLARDILDPLDDVLEIKISVADRRAVIEHRDSLAAAEIVRLLNTKHLGASLAEASATDGAKADAWTIIEVLRASVTVGQISLFGAALSLHVADVLPTTELGLSLGSIMLSWPMLHEAYIAILRRSPNVELLMAVASCGSLLLGDVLEAASVGAIVSLMDFVKMLAIERFERQLRGAAGGAPPKVDLAGGGSIAVSDLVSGSVYILRAGDCVPADGSVKSGKGSCDESRLTGEAMPQSKAKGDAVASGSVLTNGYLEVEASKPADQSFQARVADAVKDAQGTLSEAEEYVGSFAKYYTPCILVLAALIGAFQGIRQCLVIIVAGCPCALLGAAPFAHAACLAALASKHRLVVKRSTGVEALAHLRCLGLDKTGTITKGHFELLELIPITLSHSYNDIHKWVAAVEACDSHPIARSLVQSYTGCIAEFANSDATLPVAADFKRHGFCGVSATVEGRTVGVGNTDFLEASGMPWRSVEGKARATHQRFVSGGRTILFVLVDNALAAVLVLEDALKPDTPATVAALHLLGVRTLLLTGDKPEPAKRAAEAAGIVMADVHCSLLPADKQRIVLAMSHAKSAYAPVPVARPSTKLSAAEERRTRWRAKVGGLEALQQPLLVGGESAMSAAATDSTPKTRGPLAIGFVGDGLNDCAALASAHIGVVLQEVGSQATVDASSAVLQADIGELPAAILLARRTMWLIWFNVILSLAVNLAVIGAAATIGVPLWLSVAMDNGGLLLVLANSLWPLCWPVPTAIARRPLAGGGSVAPIARAAGGEAA